MISCLRFLEPRTVLSLWFSLPETHFKDMLLLRKDRDRERGNVKVLIVLGHQSSGTGLVTALCCKVGHGVSVGWEVRMRLRVCPHFLVIIRHRLTRSLYMWAEWRSKAKAALLLTHKRQGVGLILYSLSRFEGYLFIVHASHWRHGHVYAS